LSTLDRPLPLVRASEPADVLETSGIGLMQTVAIAFGALLANKLRTLLTALGVIIGVAAVVALLALGRGAQQDIVESITANGANLLTVIPGSLKEGGFSSSGGEAQHLTVDDAEALADPNNVPAAARVAPEIQTFGTIVAGDQNTAGMIQGVTPTSLEIRNNTVAQGEFFGDDHVRRAASVAVLGARMAENLFPDGDAIGRSIRIDGQRFRVIGVLATKGGAKFDSPDMAVIVPLTTVQRRLSAQRDAASGKPMVSQILVQARDEKSIDAAIAQIAVVLRERHRRPFDGSADDFTIQNQQDLINTVAAAGRTMTLFLGAISAISLVVGGIGIMNIMLVSVRERTREIGLRKAIGARERDILTQFLVEALALSTSGGLIGLLLGVLIAVVANESGRARASVAPSSAALAIGVAMAIGLFFGIEPARRAARLDPIEALRYE
jgi:putative ABC transport system permease protein